ncbi:hypothetical protein PI125_g21413 [Phytophthora idaei]|nr:hypothetical protein PI125_g21413 [Phytophthora idaei]
MSAVVANLALPSSVIREEGSKMYLEEKEWMLARPAAISSIFAPYWTRMSFTCVIGAVSHLFETHAHEPYL